MAIINQRWTIRVFHQRSGSKYFKGKRTGQDGIRINQKWRICFVWHKGQADHVEIVDYHWRVHR